MLEWIKTKSIIILGILLAISIAGNIALFWGKGINIDRHVVNNQYQSQNQSQTTMIFGNGILQSKKVKWIRVDVPNDQYESFLGSLTFEQILLKESFKKSLFSTDIEVIYPEEVK